MTATQQTAENGKIWNEIKTEIMNDSNLSSYAKEVLEKGDFFLLNGDCMTLDSLIRDLGAYDTVDNNYTPIGLKELKMSVKKYVKFLVSHHDLLARLKEEADEFESIFFSFGFTVVLRKMIQKGTYDASDADKLIEDMARFKYFGFDDEVAYLKKRLLSGQFTEKCEENKND